MNKPLDFMTNKNNPPLKVLLVGYNGANNTGSEARLLSIIQDLKDLLGNQVEITVPTLNERNLRRYLSEDEKLHIAPVPSIFFLAFDRLVKDHDLVLLVEGSCYMDTWTSALLWAFLWATNSAHRHKKPCLAYAVDAGKLSPFNSWLVKREASKTDLIVTRTKSSQARLKKIGVKAPIISTADCAFTFKEDTVDDNILEKIVPNPKKSVVGLSVVDFSLWPVVMRPWGKKENLYKWPYYYSDSPDRKIAREKLVKGWEEVARDLIENKGRNVALICMEELDEPLAREICSRVGEGCLVISSGQYNASEMTYILGELELLVTSRYHAAVLSLRDLVPQLAVGHDSRLTYFYQDINLYKDYFIPHDSPHLWEEIKNKASFLLDNPRIQRDLLKDGLQEQLRLAKHNPEILNSFLEKIMKARKP